MVGVIVLKAGQIKTVVVYFELTSEQAAREAAQEFITAADEELTIMEFPPGSLDEESIVAIALCDRLEHITEESEGHISQLAEPLRHVDFVLLQNQLYEFGFRHGCAYAASSRPKPPPALTDGS